MLGRLKKWLTEGSAGKTEAPPFEILQYDGHILKFCSSRMLPLNTALQTKLGLSGFEGPVTLDLKLRTRESYDGSRILYTADLDAPEAVRRRLFDLYAVEVGPGAAQGVERRAASRLVHHLRVRSRLLPNFQSVTHDVSAAGVRLVADGPVEPGHPMEMEIQLDHVRFKDIRTEAAVVWCRPRDAKSWWVGVNFPRLTEQQRANLEEFLEELAQTHVRGLGGEDLR